MRESGDGRVPGPAGAPVDAQAAGNHTEVLRMVAVDAREDLVPLRTDFDRAWRGYDTRQVREYVLGIESELRLLISDRDAAAANAEDLARQLEELRSENDRLREKVDRVSRTPIEPDGLSERLLRMVELAEDEAAEITERARAAAERSWAAAEQAGRRLRERHERMVTELDERRRELAAEHDQLMARTRAEVDVMAKQAAQNRRKQEEQAARRREQIENDFAQVMAARRAKALQDIAERERHAKQEADRLIAEATDAAKQLMDEAQAKADVMDELRRRTAEGLQATFKLLSEAAPLLSEPFQVPEPRNENVSEAGTSGNGRETSSEPVAG
ncbi:DivIVA domain-containing protein [Amycolatopsis taiwanensis]|nr:DivIVA domain-containing protein [Amycolatopsis taiwanensis]